jgi:nitroimidazol reductase NimA-like FMN-containing flavoprotein (pyridoxamine 5'-phosphate oxidase superfamily)
VSDIVMVDEGLEILAEDECLRLAATRPVGRVAVSIAALPAVFPVNFCLLDRDVYFRSSAGTKLDAATRNAVVAFQIDDFDSFARRGWSVLIVGRAEVLPPADVQRLEPLRVQPWVRGERAQVVRVAAELVSGRRIAPPGAAPVPTASPARGSGRGSPARS